MSIKPGKTADLNSRTWNEVLQHAADPSKLNYQPLQLPQTDMTLNQYQVLSLRTAGQFPTFNEGLAYTALGIAGEAGEVADYVKKVGSHDHPFDEGHMLKELGDVLWYLSRMAALMGYTLEDVAMGNLTKLHKRYPDGFSPEASINRKK